jgi:DNA-binding CsgD family transcriptional regulator/ribosomal protein L32
VYELQHLLSFDDWKQQNKWYKQNNKIIEYCTDNYIKENAKTPEEIILEGERLSELFALVAYLKQVLKPKAFDVLWNYCVLGKTQDQIASEYNITQQAINKFLKNIYKKVVILVSEKINYVDILLPNESTKEADSPETLGWQHEFLQKCNDGGYWYIFKNGKRKYISRKKCKLPELNKCEFNGDKNIWCTICSKDYGGTKCTRLRK